MPLNLLYHIEIIQIAIQKCNNVHCILPNQVWKHYFLMLVNNIIAFLAVVILENSLTPSSIFLNKLCISSRFSALYSAFCCGVSFFFHDVLSTSIHLEKYLYMQKSRLCMASVRNQQNRL